MRTIKHIKDIDRYAQPNHYAELWIDNRKIDGPTSVEALEAKHGSVSEWIHHHDDEGAYATVQIKKPNGHDPSKNNVRTWKQRDYFTIQERLSGQVEPSLALNGKDSRKPVPPQPQESDFQPDFSNKQSIPRDEMSKEGKLMFYEQDWRRLKSENEVKAAKLESFEQRVDTLKEENWDLKHTIKDKEAEIERNKKNNEMLRSVATPEMIQSLPGLLQSIRGSGAGNQQQALSGPSLDETRQELLAALESHPTHNVRALTTIAQIMGTENGEAFGEELADLINKYQPQNQ